MVLLLNLSPVSFFSSQGDGQSLRERQIRRALRRVEELLSNFRRGIPPSPQLLKGIPLGIFWAIFSIPPKEMPFVIGRTTSRPSRVVAFVRNSDYFRSQCRRGFNPRCMVPGLLWASGLPSQFFFLVSQKFTFFPCSFLNSGRFLGPCRAKRRAPMAGAPPPCPLYRARRCCASSLFR